MTTSGPLLDTRDMLAIHRCLDGALASAPGEIAAIGEDDVARAAAYSSYLGEVLWLLHIHHEGEDELLYPRLIERAPEEATLCQQMDSQHADVKHAVEAAEVMNATYAATGSRTDGAALAGALTELAAVLSEHVGDEETHVLPLAARLISPEEWGQLPAHALRAYDGARIWLVLGLVFEQMPDEMVTGLMSMLPPPLVEMWNGGGSAAFQAEMATIRV